MKKQICFILALTLLAALVAVPAFALPGSTDGYDPEPTNSDIVTLTGFYNVGTAAGVTVQVASAGGVVEGLEMSVDIDDNSATGTGGYDEITMYPDSDRLMVSYSEASDAKYYIVMLSEGSELPTSSTAIFYMDQITGAAFSNVKVYPNMPGERASLSLWIIGDDVPVRIPLGYADGSHYEKPVAGYTVLVDNKATNNNHITTVAGIVSGGAYSGNTEFTVACDIACVVAYTTNGGVSYTNLKATLVAGNEYSFTIPVNEAATVLIAYAGDINLNGTFNNQDVTMLNAANLGKRSLTAAQRALADVNYNKTFNNQDVTMLNAANLGKRSLNWEVQ